MTGCSHKTNSSDVTTPTNNTTQQTENKSVEKSPDEILAEYITEAENLTAHGDTAKALDTLEEALKLNESSVAVYVNKAIIYRLTNEDELFKQNLEKALTINATKTIAAIGQTFNGSIEKYILYAVRGEAYKYTGNVSPAISDLGQAIRYAPAAYQPELLTERAWMLFDTGDYEKAITDFSSVIELEPGNYTAYSNKTSG